MSKMPYKTLRPSERPREYFLIKTASENTTKNHRTTPQGHFARNQGRKQPIVSLGTPTPRIRSPTPTPRGHHRKRVKVVSGKVRLGKPAGKPPTKNDYGVLFR